MISNMLNRNLSFRSWCALLVVVVFATTWQTSASAQIDQDKQDRLETTHSVLQKAGLGTLLLTGTSGATLMINKPTLFGEGRCKTGDPLFGGFGCSGLSLVHFAMGAASLGLFVSSEIVAENMPISPYDMGTAGEQDTMRALRYTNIGLFAVQPLLGLVSAYPQLIGIPERSRESFSKIMRTVHFGVGGSLATTYSINAALQW